MKFFIFIVFKFFFYLVDNSINFDIFIGDVFEFVRFVFNRESVLMDVD